MKKSHSGRTSPGLNVNKFKIPKKQKELLNEVELDSSEYLREVLPIIHQGYRDSSSKNKFNYEKVQLVHNPAIKKEFIEKKREMKDAGRNEKELNESYAYLCVNTDEKAKQLSEESLHAGTKRRKNMHCLGSPKMGVHVCRYSDVLHRNGVPNEGKLILFKILKGKVKAVPLVYGASEILEPTPNYDCHVAKNSGEDIPSSAIHRLFDSSELFIYDFDEDEVEFRKRPRNVCPFAVVHFTYSDTGIASTASSSSSFNRTPVASSNESTPTRNISVPDTVGIAVVAPCFPRDEIFTQKTISDADRPFIEKYNEYSERSYRVWSGQLLNKNGNSCRVSLVSFGLSFMPCKMPEALRALKAVRIRELRLPNKVFTGSVPVLSRVKEAQANGKYYWYAELHSLSLDDAVYSRFLNYLSEKELVLKKDLGDRVLLYILPTGRTTQNLGLTSTSHPKIMHCLVESCVPMVSHLTDITVKQPRHQVKPNLESAPIHDIDKDHLKRLRFQSSLAKLFFEQNKELKNIGVKGDKEECPVPVALPRQPSYEQSVEQSSVEPEDDDEVEKVSEMSPASPDEQVDENLNVFIPRTQQMDSLQSNQRTALHSKPSASPIDKHPSTDRQDWKNFTDRNRDQLGNKQSWDHSHPKPIHPKDQRRHSIETKEIHAKRDPPENHKQLQLGEVPNIHVGKQSPSHHSRSSHPSEHYQTGQQQHRQQPVQTEHQTVIPESPSSPPPSSNLPEHHQLGRQQYQHQLARRESPSLIQDSPSSPPPSSNLIEDQSGLENRSLIPDSPSSPPPTSSSNLPEPHQSGHHPIQQQPARTEHQPVIQDSPSSPPPSSNLPENHPFQQQSSRTEHRSVSQESQRGPPRSAAHLSQHHRPGHPQYQQQPARTDHRVGHPPHGHWSSKEWGPPKGPPRGMESSSQRPPQLPHHQQRHPSNPSSNQQYKRQSSSDWTSQQPSAKHRPPQDRRPPEAAKPDLPPQIKEVASKVHSMLTGGIDLALKGASGDTNVQKVRQETDDEKIARMRATLQALVEERERLAKNNSDKNSANPPTSVTPKGNQVLCSSSTTSDATSEPKAHSTESHNESTVEKPKECKVLEKSGESALPKGNGNDTDMKMKAQSVLMEGKVSMSDVEMKPEENALIKEKDTVTDGSGKERVDLDIENTTNSVESDGGKDSQKGAKQEKVKEKDSVKRKLEEIKEEPAKKKIKVDDVPTAGAETKSSVPTQDVPVLPKDHPAVPKNNLQKNVEIGVGKTVSKPIGGTDQQPKEPPSQEPTSAETPLADPMKTVPATKPQKDPKKLQTLEKKPKSTVEDKSKLSKKETSVIPGKVPKEITSASQMREYLERKHGTNKKGPEEPISSASEMKMFLENPDKVSTKMKRINSASEMCQFLNQPLIRNQHKGRSTADNARLCRELEGKSRDDLLKNHDGEFTNSHLQNFLSTRHQITWNLSQGLRVTVERDMAGALHLDPPPPGTLTEVMTEVDACNSSIMAVCHGSQRSMNGMEPDTSTREGLAYQIRQVIHHSKPVKKLEPRKVKAVQKGEDGKRKNSTRNSTESRDSLRSESPAYIPDGKKKDNSKPTSKKQSQKLRPTFPVKKNSTNKAETPAGHAIGIKDSSLLQLPRKSLKLKIKKIKKVYTAIPSSEEEIEKEKATIHARQDLGSTKGLSQRKKDNASTETGKPPGPRVSAKRVHDTKLDHLSYADRDKVVHQAKGVSEVNSIIGVLPAIDVTESVRDVVKCLSTDEIRQLIGVYDELFNRRPDVKEIQPVQMDSKDSPDAIQQSTVHPWAAGDTGQSGLQRVDQDVGANKRMTNIAPDESVSEKISDVKDHLSDLASVSHDEVTAKCPKDHVQELEKDHSLEWDIEEEDIVTDIKQPGEHLLPGQDLSFLKKMETGCPGDDIHPLTEDHRQEPLTSPVLDINENEKPVDDIKLAEDEDTQDTLPYPLDPVLNGANEMDEGTASSTDGKVLMNEACIHLYDSDRWSELDEEIQTDASQGNASQEDAVHPSKAQPVNAGTDRLEKTFKPVVDAGDTALTLMSHTDVLSILIRECKNKTPIRQKTDKEHLEGTKGLSVFERLSTYQSSARNVVKGEGEISDPSVMSSEASRYPEECGDKLKRNESPQPTSSLPVPADASQRTTSSIGDKGAKKEEKSSKVSVFDRLTSKQVDEQPPKKKVSVFDRLFVPKPNKPEPAQSELGKSERVSAFDRLSSRKVTKASPQKKKQKGDSTSISLSKIKKEKTTGKPTLPSKVIKVDSGRATTAVSSKVVAVKSKKTDEVIQKERQNPEKDMPKANSKKREHPKEDIPASKKYKLAAKDQGVKKDKYMDKSKESVTVKTDKSKESITVKKEDKVLRKDLVKRPVSQNDPSRETFAVINKSKQTSERLGKKEEKELDVQRSRDTSNKKSNIVPQNQSRRDKNNKDNRSVKTSDQGSDKRPISRTKEDRRIREERNRDSKDRDSDQSSVSTKEDSDSIRQNILRRANGPTSDFSKYVVSGRYRKLDRESPSRSETPTNSLTNNAGFEPDHDMTGERKVVDRYPGEGLSKCFSETHKVEIKNVDETQQYSLQPSYPIVDQIPKATDLSQVNEQQIHTISVIGGSTLNSMRPFCEASEDSDSITTSLPDDLPLDRISVVGNRENDGYLRQVKVESYNSASPETPTVLSPDTKREVEQVLKASIDSLTNEYRPESPTDSIRSVQSGHQDQFSEISNIPPTTSSYSEISCKLTQNTSAFTQSTYNRDEHSEDCDNSRKVKASLKAPSSRQVVYGNRFHPYDKRLKSFQGHCHSIREPETTELTDNFCKEEYRLRKLRAAARATSQEEFFDQARCSPSRFVSLHDMSHDEGVILKAEEVEVTHSRESAGDTSVGQKGDQLQILDRQIEALTAAGSDIQDFFILDANIYPIKNGDDSALSGVPARVRARRGRGRHPPRQQGPPHPYQIRTHQDDGYRGHPQDRWNVPADRFWNGPSQRSFDRPLDRPPDYPPPSRFHYRKGY
ncbi:uncharacterized protein LOC129257956 [Lytechinus pictus]|uniref:uncharacterized protein LOC129257956 n=1 Tax=Lytechinus pictus TaxID=7653 RepID=UPI0030B9FA1D